MNTTLRLRPLGLGRNFRLTSASFTPPIRSPASNARTYANSHSLPKIADTSVWTSMIPRFIRERKSRKSGKSKEWNPATFYIVMFTLIGSQAIRMLTLKNSYATYTRSTDAKIELLKEVIERVQRGEKVDVEKLLGTGDEAKEREWDQVLQEIEQEDLLWQQRRSKESKNQPLENKTGSTQPSQEKESAVPATENVDAEATKTQSTRKLNFF